MPRIEQLNELLRGELAHLIARDSVLDNGLITIIHVKHSPDLRYAKISISVLPENLSGTALRELRKRSKRFSQALKKKLNLKYIPRLTWIIDPTERRAAEMDKAWSQHYA